MTLPTWPTCCLRSFVAKADTLENDFTCATCGRGYRVKWVNEPDGARHGIWTEVVQPLKITDEEVSMEFADDICHWCGTHIGFGMRLLHLGVCDQCRERRPS
jgi:hypothetical protein